MRQGDFYSFPPLTDDIDGLLSDIDGSLQRTVFFLGGLLLPAAGFLLYLLGAR